MNLQLTKEEQLKIIDEALTHIKKVEADPDVKMEKVDPYDAWFSFNERIDFNVHEANFGMIENPPRIWGLHEDDSSKFEWHCSAYAVELDEDEYFRINTDITNFLFSYKEGKVTFHND